MASTHHPVPKKQRRNDWSEKEGDDDNENWMCPGPAFAEILAATEQAQLEEIENNFRAEVQSIARDDENVNVNANAATTNDSPHVVAFLYRAAVDECLREIRLVEQRCGTQTGWLLACGTNDNLALGIVEPIPGNRGADHIPTTPLHNANDVPQISTGIAPRYTQRNLRNQNIRAVSHGGMFSMAVSTHGTVYSWGSSDGGCLGRVAPPGLGDDDDPADDENPDRKSGQHVWEETPQLVQGLHKAILQVVAGNNHAAFLDADGNVLVSGMYLDADSGKFRDVPPPSSQNVDPVVVMSNEPNDPPPNINETPVPIDLPLPAIHIYSGQSSNYTYALLEDGSLYSWGLGNSGELGRTETMKLPRGPGGKLTTDRSIYVHPHDGSIDRSLLMEYLRPGRVVLDKSKIVLSVACGFAHVAIAARESPTGQGRIYTCGRNNYGQLGNGLACTPNNAAALAAGGIVDQHRFEPVTALEDEDMAHVAAGEFHVLALTLSGTRLYSWGRCDKGQLGLGYDYGKKGGVDHVATPTIVTFYHQSQRPVIKDVACGGSHSMALTYTGDVYTWGYTDWKDIRATGHRAPFDSDIYVPTKLEMQVGSQGPRFMCSSFAGGPQASLFLVTKRP